MKLSRRKALAVALSVAATATLAHVGMPTEMIADQRKTDLDAMFPSAFGDWQLDRSMPVILPAPDVQARLDAIYNQVLSRSYVNTRTQERVMLSVAYGGDQSDGMNIHLPEVCYPAQGFEVRSRERGVVQAADREIPVIRLATKLGGRHEPVTYWITVGDAVVPTRTQQKFEQIRYGLKGQVPDGMLIRVSSIDVNSAKGFATQERFIRDLADSVSGLPYAPRLIGTA